MTTQYAFCLSSEKQLPWNTSLSMRESMRKRLQFSFDGFITTSPLHGSMSRKWGTSGPSVVRCVTTFTWGNFLQNLDRTGRVSILFVAALWRVKGKLSYLPERTDESHTKSRAFCAMQGEIASSTLRRS